MKPFNALATQYLPIPPGNHIHEQIYLFKRMEPVPLLAEQKRVLERLKLSVATTPNLHSAFFMEFKEKETECTLYMNNHSALSQNQFKGLCHLVIRAIQNFSFHDELKIPSLGDKTSLDKDIALNKLDSFKDHTRYFAIFLYNKHIHIGGNMFDESICCQWMLEYQPPKKQSVIRNLRSEETINPMLPFFSTDSSPSVTVRYKNLL